MTSPFQQGRVSRRGFLAASGAGVAAAVSVSACSATSPSVNPSLPRQADAIKAVAATGVNQAGIVRPGTPQPQLVSLVFDLPEGIRKNQAARLLEELGDTILDLGEKPLLDVVSAADLTVTVGIGPRLVSSVDRTLPGADELPRYRREDIAPKARGGDLWLQICGSDPLAVSLAEVSLRERLGDAAQLNWRQSAWRGDSGLVESSIKPRIRAPRNVMGFQDGITLPRGDEELNEGVWISEPAPLSGATIAVVRRFRFDMAGWRALDVEEQQKAVGRELVSSRPLSGGEEIDLGAKTPEGDYLVPADAHARRAHPLALGVPVMLRRSYSIDDPYPGLLFISFQNTLRAFTATMSSLDVTDRMLDYTTTTATGAFLVLPGFTRSSPLGAVLFA
jgi:dye decolorizing peroxidase